MIIYKLTNKITGKNYIGQTITRIQKRMYSHFNSKNNTAISKAIQSYGKENFIIEVIDTAKNKNCLDKKEVFWIKHFNSLVPNGYNLESGGTRYKIVSEETRKKISKSHSGTNAVWYGKKLYPETRAKLSEAHKGKKGYWTGKKRDKKTIEKMTENRKGKTVGLTHIQSKKIKCVQTGVIYDSIGEASRIEKISRTGIINHLKGKTKKAGGYTWEYVL